MSGIGSNIYTRGRLYLNNYTTSRIDRRYDQDWFRIYLNAGQRVRFDLEGSPTGRGSLRDTYLRGIYNSSGSYISNTRNDDGGSGRNSRVTFTASSTGYYYVAAGAYGSRTGSYRLTATNLGSSSTRRPDLVVASGSASGNFTAGGRVYASVTVRNQGSGSAGSSYVGYYLSTNSTITTSDTRLDYDYVSSLRSGRSGNEYEGFYLPRNLRAGQTYYIGAIADYTGRVSESNEGNNARVLKSFTVAPTDDFSQNTGTQGRLSLGGNKTGNIESSGDRDWFRIRLNAGQQVRFDLEGRPTSRGTLSDTYLRGIYDSSGSYISGTRNDDGRTSVNSRVDFTASSTGYYYVAAGAFGSNTGTYRLTATALNPEVSVSGNGYNINDGDTSPRSADYTNFGSVDQNGNAIYRTFTVRNTGNAILTTSGLRVTAGFTVTNGLASSIAAGGSDTFTVRMDTATPGIRSGQISFNTNDSSESTFNYSISGTVTSTLWWNKYFGNRTAPTPSSMEPYMMALLSTDSTNTNINPWPTKNITYSFDRISNAGTNSTLDWANNTDAEKAVELAFKSWEAIADISFSSAASNDADFHFYLASDDWMNSATGKTTAKGFMYGQGKSGTRNGITFTAGDMVLRESSTWAPGERMFSTIIHELGHGLGLQHPHFDSGDDRSFPNVTNNISNSRGDIIKRTVGDFSQNQGVYTVMSYNRTVNGVTPKTPMALDIAAAQMLYGPNTSTNSGSNIYDLNDAYIGNLATWRCIWDKGGDKDSIVMTGSQDVIIDLRDAEIDINNLTQQASREMGGYISRIKPSRFDDKAGGFTIAHGVRIENAKGGSGDDQITGNEFNNDLEGGAGRDTLTGGGGNDIFKFTDLGTDSDADTITDFTSGTDKIQVVSPNFGNLSVGSLALDRFLSTGATLTDANPVFLYDNGTGSLRFDRDGHGNAAPVQIASLTGNRNLNYSDIQIVAA
uniref:Hemolysin-type calcium-binding repeat-containing protein n=1 Tax=Candidatus Kentrum sp. SD TaxID=2126332 RepID=A0A450YK34_9GAMM|nr:MAG: Hemolysin-type calcium-binding repeat-containing protein [Candidatus Kentron sp. SD]VFK47851.1 MAG: Hemolysin-type calcium-binding repeat-containing protein [Candidatus Kentron sp. SD]